jgi:tetratricopeptide (TPR) repeat protein
MVPSWRWMVEGDRSPWYGTVRLFRQPRRGAWAPVFDQLGKMLRELAASPANDLRRRAHAVQAPLVLDEAASERAAEAHDDWLDGSQICVKATMDSLPDLMAQAEAHANRGELAEAEAIYRRVLSLAPRFPSALHGLSRVARRQGNPELAIRSVKRALSTAEHVPERRCDLAAALADARRYDEAAESYLRAIELDPHLYRAHFELGSMLQGLGRHEEALARFQQAAAIAPENPAPAVARAKSLRALCRPDEAIECLQALCVKHPACTDALLLLAEIHGDDQSFAEAEQCLRRAIAANRELVEAELRLADVLATTGRDEEAVASYERTISQQPTHYKALVELGMLHDRLCRPADAERCFRQARLECCDSSQLWISNGANLSSANFTSESSAEKESDDKSSHSTQAPRELINSLGLTLADQGRLEEALHCYDQALAISGDEPYPMAHTNRAFALVQLGRFAEGWREYEWRWRCPGAGRPRDHLRAPAWDGSHLEGRTILIHGEQGLGDEIMFATCYPDIIEQAAKTIISCEPRLERLFRRSFPAATIIAVVRGMEHQWQIPDRTHVDWQVPAGSLPLHLRPDEASFPRRAQLIKPDTAAVTHWRERFDALGPGLKIGISWCAGDKPKERRLRSTRLNQWGPLLETPECHFISLQHGNRSAEIDALKGETGVTVHHWRDADNRNDIDGLAARIAALDLVISVGNANVHLAGALGVPAWSLLPAHGGWRWLAGRSDTLWYASVRLFRQAAAGDWAGLFLRVRQELLNHQRRSADQKTMPNIAGPHAAFGGMSKDEVRMTNSGRG